MDPIEVREGDLTLYVGDHEVTADLLAINVDRGYEYDPIPPEPGQLGQYVRARSTVTAHLDVRKGAGWVNDLWDDTERRDLTLTVRSPLHYSRWRRFRNALARLVMPDHRRLPEYVEAIIPMLDMGLRRISYGSDDAVHVEFDNRGADS